MNQLTLRGLDASLEYKLKTLAKEKNISLNKAALMLMREGAGLSTKQPSQTIDNSLDHLIGSWSEEEERAFLESQAIFDSLDEDLWR